MFSLGGSILLMCMGAGDSMRHAEITKEFVQLDILASPIGLNMDNFAIKKPLNMSLELKKHIEHLIFALKQV
jgi:hypothetical protein